MAAIIGLVGTCTGIIVGLIALYHHLRPNCEVKILVPPGGSENYGRKLTVSGTISNRRWRAVYWLAVQPSDCREKDLWWPQRAPLTFHNDGSWRVQGVTLGRDFNAGGSDDVGAIYTLAVFQLPARSTNFEDDVPLSPPTDSSILCTTDVRRIEC